MTILVCQELNEVFPGSKNFSDKAGKVLISGWLVIHLEINIPVSWKGKRIEHQTRDFLARPEVTSVYILLENS